MTIVETSPTPLLSPWLLLFKKRFPLSHRGVKVHDDPWPSGTTLVLLACIANLNRKKEKPSPKLTDFESSGGPKGCIL